MATLVVPVGIEPDQQFNIDLDGQTVTIRIRWNATAKQWVMDFAGVTFDTTVNGIVMVAGVNLLRPYAIRELGQLWLVDLEEKNGEPGSPEVGDLGDRFQLLYVEL